MEEETQYNGKGRGYYSLGKVEGRRWNGVKGLLCCLEVVWSPLIGVIG